MKLVPCLKAMVTTPSNITGTLPQVACARAQERKKRKAKEKKKKKKKKKKKEKRSKRLARKVMKRRARELLAAYNSKHARALGNNKQVQPVLPLVTARLDRGQPKRTPNLWESCLKFRECKRREKLEAARRNAQVERARRMAKIVARSQGRPIINIVQERINKRMAEHSMQKLELFRELIQKTIGARSEAVDTPLFDDEEAGSLAGSLSGSLGDHGVIEVVGPAGERLSEHELERVNNALDEDADGEEVLAENATTKLYRTQLLCLRDGLWLNDEVMNFKFDMLNEQHSAGGARKVWVWNTHFYVKLMDHQEKGGSKCYTYSNVRRWTKRKKLDIFQLDRVVVPVHEGVHWTCAVVDFVAKRIDYFDSMHIENPACTDALAQWVQDESLDKKGVHFALDDWTIGMVESAPSQDNSFDCGVFAVLFAQAAATGARIDFDHRHIPYFRRKLVLELLDHSKA